MERSFDVIVIGLGAMGSAAVYHLSKHTKVLGLEAFIPAHDKGSSHGESRILPCHRSLPNMENGMVRGSSSLNVLAALGID